MENGKKFKKKFFKAMGKWEASQQELTEATLEHEALLAQAVESGADPTMAASTLKAEDRKRYLSAVAAEQRAKYLARHYSMLAARS